ncbi:hypothetical protein [Synechococcus sp. CS-1327]|nr:hypothetical protein [Synechococcus sp. CS-1327]MCT0234140.1 hypothetical protein [Synechococcus sp. CS-1327]
MIAVLFTVFHGVIEPLIQWGTPLFELRGWIWLPLLLAGWSLAGQRR